MTSAEHLLVEAQLQDTYWGERILKAEDRGKFTDEDIDESTSWATCPCNSKPKKYPFYNLGVSFSVLAKGNQFRLAARTLIEIERLAKKDLDGNAARA